jgi:hypothetical protein
MKEDRKNALLLFLAAALLIAGMSLDYHWMEKGEQYAGGLRQSDHARRLVSVP